MGIIIPILLLISSYLLGSIPNALIVSKFFGNIDIREYGSKNMGATNVYRVLGFKYGLLVFGLDALKAGIIISLFTCNIIIYNASWLVIPIHPLIYGIMAIIGHMFPVFANFKGGKGVSCFAGILAAYAPLIFIGAAIIYILLLMWKKYISLSSVVVTILIFIVSFFWKDQLGNTDYFFIATMTVITIFIVIKHIPNIKRICLGTEPKFTFKKPLPESKS